MSACDLAGGGIEEPTWRMGEREGGLWAPLVPPPRDGVVTSRGKGTEGEEGGRGLDPCPRREEGETDGAREREDREKKKNMKVEAEAEYIFVYSSEGKHKTRRCSKGESALNDDGHTMQDPMVKQSFGTTWTLVLYRSGVVIIEVNVVVRDDQNTTDAAACKYSKCSWKYAYNLAETLSCKNSKSYEPGPAQ